METEQAILTRRAIRRYRDEPIPEEVLKEVYTAGRWAPSAGNQQPWRFIEIADPTLRRKLSALHAETIRLCAHWNPDFRPGGSLAEPYDFGAAPAAVAVVSDPNKGGLHIHNHQSDVHGASHCIQNMWLRAHSLGLGATLHTQWVDERVKALLNVPLRWNLGGVMTLGHPDEQPTSERRPLGELCFAEQFGRPLPLPAAEPDFGETSASSVEPLSRAEPGPTRPIEEVILERRTYRVYTEREVDEPLLLRILNAGRWAPSAGNKQPFRFIVLRDPENKRALWEVAKRSKETTRYWVKFFREGGLRSYVLNLPRTPVAVAVVADPAASGEWLHNENHAALAAGMAVQNMVLLAYSFGIGCVFYTHWNAEHAKAQLDIPPEWDFLGVVGMGYPDYGAEQGFVVTSGQSEREVGRRRRPLEELLFLNHFGSPKSPLPKGGRRGQKDGRSAPRPGGPKG